MRGVDMDSILYALMLTLIAGSATGLGALMVIFVKRNNTKLMSGALGFSAGVMVYVSMVEIYAQGKSYLENVVGEGVGGVYITIAFFVGLIVICIIDWFLPSDEGDIGSLRENRNSNLNRMGMMTALAIAIHNFPEGMVTFITSVKSPVVGVAICAAIAIHNIPEGMATAMPIYYSGADRRKAFLISCLSGMTEPLGALVGYLLLKPFLNDFVFGVVFGVVSGIMVFISIEELLPMAREYDKGKRTVVGFISGMGIMALSMIMFS